MTAGGNDARTWRIVFALTFLAAATWSLGTPLFTGPDELSQQRRAAAAARGQWTGTFDGDDPPILVDVEVPLTYGDPAEEYGRCFVRPVVESAPQTPMPEALLARSECPGLPSGSNLVGASTVQGRGQPFLYALAGLPTRLSSGPIGSYGARLVVAAMCAALVASAACSTRLARRRSFAGSALVLTLTPAVVYLAGSTNPSGVEITAAVGAWASGTVLAVRAAPERTGRLIGRTMAALTVLVLARGMGPLFGGVIVAGLAVVAGWGRCVELLRRRDLRVWAAVLAAAVAASAAWTLHIRETQPNPERVGSGWMTAVGYLRWYLHQSVGVFGSNDSELPMAMSAVWVALALAIVVVSIVACLRHHPRAPRAAVLAVLCLVGGLAVQVTAEGLDLPPIGFYWQGRYALPLLFGALVVASTAAGPLPSPLRRVGRPTRLVVVAVTAGAHLWSFVEVARHHGGLARGSVSVTDALIHTAWDAPLPLWLLAGTYVVAMAGLGGYVTAAREATSDDSTEPEGEPWPRGQALGAAPHPTTGSP